MRQLIVFITIASLAITVYLLSNKGASMTNVPSTNENATVVLTTSLGAITLELYPNRAPETVKNFIKYVNDGHYDNTLFHRVIEGFMIQGGGYTPDLQLKPTRSAIKNESTNGLTNQRGAVAMARTSEVNSATAQFFINVVDNPFLNYRGQTPQEFGYCVFGKVVEGMDIVDKIKNVETQSQGPYRDLPAKPVVILRAEQVKKG